MKQFSRQEVADRYAALMRSVKNRVEAFKYLVGLARTLPPGIEQDAVFESCVLQIRLMYETVAIAVLTAHQLIEEATTKKYRDSWNAKALLDALEKINQSAFPEKLIRAASVEGTLPNFRTDATAMTKDEFCKAYNRCGDLLHAGSLKQLLRGKKREYRVSELMGWHNRLVDLLSLHGLALPEFKMAITCAMQERQSGNVRVTVAELTELLDSSRESVDRWRASTKNSADR